MAFGTLEDLEGAFDLVVFSEPYVQFGNLLKLAIEGPENVVQGGTELIIGKFRAEDGATFWQVLHAQCPPESPPMIFAGDYQDGQQYKAGSVVTTPLGFTWHANKLTTEPADPQPLGNPAQHSWRCFSDWAKTHRGPRRRCGSCSQPLPF